MRLGQIVINTELLDLHKEIDKQKTSLEKSSCASNSNNRQLIFRKRKNNVPTSDEPTVAILQQSTNSKSSTKAAEKEEKEMSTNKKHSIPITDKQKKFIFGLWEQINTPEEKRILPETIGQARELIDCLKKQLEYSPITEEQRILLIRLWDEYNIPEEQRLFPEFSCLYRKTVSLLRCAQASEETIKKLKGMINKRSKCFSNAQITQIKSIID